MRRAWTRILLGLSLVAVAATVVAVLSARYEPGDLRTMLERRLSDAIDSPVRIQSAAPLFRVGLGLGVEGRGIEIWPSPGGPSLSVDRARARIDLLSLLLGRFRLDWLILEGAHMRIERDALGRWSPPPFQQMSDEDVNTETPHPEELLSPLIEIEGFARWLLARPYLADTLDIRSSELEFVDAGHADGERVEVTLVGIESRLRHRRVRRDATLRFVAQLPDGAPDEDELVWTGHRSRSGEIRLGLVTHGFDLARIAPYLRQVRPAARLEGALSGETTFESPSPGEARLGIEWTVRDLVTEAPAPGASAIRADEAALRVDLRVSPQRARLETFRFSHGDLVMRGQGVFERPVGSDSGASLSLALHEVDLARLRDLIGWFPESGRPGVAALVNPLEAGRITVLRARGVDSLPGWQAFFAGRTERLPVGFTLDAELRDARIGVGAADHLDHLSGRIGWSGDELQAFDVRSELNGGPLPRIDARLRGVSNLFQTRKLRRVIPAGTEPLLGLSPLWRVLNPEGDDSGGGMQTPVRLEIETIQHPMFLWPIDDLEAVIAPTENGVHIALARGTWAGVPVRGEADWIFEPEEAMKVTLFADAPRPDAVAPSAVDGWARGRFSVGALDDGVWRQKGASGSFRARGGTVAIEDLDVELEPVGRISASGNLTLEEPDLVPYHVSFAVVGGDMAALCEQLGLDENLADGRIDLNGTFEGALDPTKSPFASLSGFLSVSARDGSIGRTLPAGVAIALASESFNPFAKRDRVRYSRIDSAFEFLDGKMRTDAFELEGPDLRVFASGSVDIAHEPHDIDANVALFLFRQLDRAIDKIPVLNLLLLGADESLAAAYFELEGPWDDPHVDVVPLRSLGTGPAGAVLGAVPRLVQLGIEAIGKVVRANVSKPGDGAADAGPPDPAMVP